jgi:hypothetical protein
LKDHLAVPDRDLIGRHSPGRDLIGNDLPGVLVIVSISWVNTAGSRRRRRKDHRRLRVAGKNRLPTKQWLNASVGSSAVTAATAASRKTKQDIADPP